jgi:hypothetical protein
MNKVGKQYFDKTLFLFREYDNSALILFAGSADFSKSYSHETMKNKLDAFSKLYSFQNTTDPNFTPKLQFIENKKRMFRRLTSNIKKYADVLLEWNKKDILNNPLQLLQIVTPKKTSEKKTTSISRKETTKNSPKSPSMYKSKKIRPQMAISVSSGGKKTRRKRK